MRCLPPVALWLLVAAPAGAGDGLYVWERAVLMTDGDRDDAERQRRLLDFSARVAVDRLYVLVDPDRLHRPSLRRLVMAAGRRGMAVYAVPPGSIQHRWIRSFRATGRCRHRVVLDWMDRALPVAGLAGIQLDIEPHRARGKTAWGRRKVMWQRGTGGFLRGRRNRRIGEQYLEMLDAIRAHVDRRYPGLEVAVTVPSWWDRDDAGESYRLEYAGHSKTLAHHVMDRVDFVTVMDYEDGTTPASLERAWRAIADEVRYGRTEALLETARPDAARSEETLFEEGEDGYRALRRWLGGWFAGHPNFVGCAAHHYGDAYGSGQPGWPTR